MGRPDIGSLIFPEACRSFVHNLISRMPLRAEKQVHGMLLSLKCRSSLVAHQPFLSPIVPEPPTPTSPSLHDRLDPMPAELADLDRSCGSSVDVLCNSDH